MHFFNFDEQIAAYHKREVSAGRFGSRAVVNCLQVVSCKQLTKALEKYVHMPCSIWHSAIPLLTIESDLVHEMPGGERHSSMQ